MKIQDCSEFVRGFLNRIGINEGEINPDLETLKKIHTNCFEYLINSEKCTLLVLVIIFF